MDLPPGFTTRPATLEDAPEAAALFNLYDIQMIGKPFHDEDSIRSEWQTPSFHLETDTVCMISPEGSLVAYGEVWERAPHVVAFTWGRVHPDYQGRGFGAWLVDWCEQRAAHAVRRAPSDARIVIRQGVQGSDTRAHTLLESRSYTVIRQFHTMMIELNASLPAPAFPAGLEMRTFAEHGDLAALIRADQDAFRDHWGFVQRPLEEEMKEWKSRMETAPDFDASLWFLAMAGEEIAGICICWPHRPNDPDREGWVGVLGVRRPWRRQGLALAMLHHAFGEFYRRGSKQVALGVDADSLTGATRLYEKAGMHVERYTYTYEKELRPGKDLSVQSV